MVVVANVMAAISQRSVTGGGAMTAPMCAVGKYDDCGDSKWQRRR